MRSLILISFMLSGICFAAEVIPTNELFQNQELIVSICEEAHYEFGDEYTTQKQIKDYCLKEFTYRLVSKTRASTGEVTIKNVVMTQINGTKSCELKLVKYFPQKTVLKNGEILIKNGGWTVEIADGSTWCL